MAEFIDSLVPIVSILVIPVVFWIVNNRRFKQFQESQKTLRVALEQGQPISSELIQQLTADIEGRRNRRLRYCVMLTALGLGIVCFGVFQEGLGSERDLGLLLKYLGAGLFFLCLALGELVLWKWFSKKE